MENDKLNSDTSIQINENEDIIEVDLKEVLFILKNHIMQIIGCFLSGAIIALLVTIFLITPKYTSTATMYVVSGSSSVVDLSALQIGTQIKADYKELMKSRTILEEVIDELDLSDFTIESLSSCITISNTSDTRILNISVETTNAQLSADIANELAKESMTYLPSIMKTDSLTLVDEALVPTSKSSPSTSKNVLLGGLLVSIIYCAYLIIRMITNDTFVTPDDIYKKFGVQPLATIPEQRKKRSGKKKGAK